MLVKAFRTKYLGSYSFGNVLMSNDGNLIYSIYVVDVPSGPIWFSQGYNWLSTGLPLIWYLKHKALTIRLLSLGDCLVTSFQLSFYIQEK